MKEVAEKAGVSIATVSAVVNKTKYVSDELRERIENVIEEVGYRPNRNARSLKGKATNLVGVTVTEVTNPFYPLMIKGVEDASHEYGYNVLLSTTGDNESKEIKLLESMLDQGVDGVILSTVDKADSKPLALAVKAQIPLVLINRAPKGYKGNLVCVDSYKVGQVATQHLIDLGHSSIAFFGGERQNSYEREKGFRDTMARNNLEVSEEFILNGEYDSSISYKKMRSLIEHSNPTGVYAASDIMAFGVIKACLDAGLSVPGDVSIIGSDNVKFSEDFKVSLTTVDVQTYQMGKKGLEILRKNIRFKNEVEPQQVWLEPKIVVRESTALLTNKTKNERGFLL
ncbi:LacI family DNA-binding transcriptional regulator [Bacillus sp. FJAT-44742]|uniref:LacI family DNA-binding transcriptional regulator n=1 Tax=Bacillus sp. FJAT-44742 TaxID=2014005 RepID=UPI000C24A7B5|nr:LacI family DNA-binding transcriptional regulator [Bacillus sp. FJAT-44742]